MPYKSLFFKILFFFVFFFQSYSLLADVRAYGIFDAGVSLVNNGSQNKVAMTSGTGTAARLGVRWTELIHNQLSADFLIETFMTLDDGSNYGMESTYNSATFAGFKYKKFLHKLDSLGEFSIRFGRQRSILHDRLYLYDPMRQNLIGSPTGFAMYSMFYDKMVKMIAKLRRKEEMILLRLMFIPGNHSKSANNEYSPFNVNHGKIPYGSWGVSFRWDRAPFSLKSGYQIEKNTTQIKQNESFLSVIKYTFNKIDLFGGYLQRTPGKQIFLEKEENIRSNCFYLGFGAPLKRFFTNINGKSSIVFSYARPKVKSLTEFNNGQVQSNKNYSADQWGVAIKKSISKKTSFYLFAGKIYNSGQSKFSLEAIPYDIPSVSNGGKPSVIGFSINQRY